MSWQWNNLNEGGACSGVRNTNNFPANMAICSWGYMVWYNTRWEVLFRKTLSYRCYFWDLVYDYACTLNMKIIAVLCFFSVQNIRPCLNRKLSSHRVWLLGGLRMQGFTYYFYNRRTFALVSLHISSNDAFYIAKPFGWKSKAWWSHSVNRVWKCMPFCLKTWIKIGPK